MLLCGVNGIEYTPQDHTHDDIADAKHKFTRNRVNVVVDEANVGRQRCVPVSVTTEGRLSLVNMSGSI
jgi:hypothetical protein